VSRLEGQGWKGLSHTGRSGPSLQHARLLEVPRPPPVSGLFGQRFDEIGLGTDEFAQGEVSSPAVGESLRRTRPRLQEGGEIPPGVFETAETETADAPAIDGQDEGGFPGEKRPEDRLGLQDTGSKFRS
jgi:hypothetical protein